MVAVILLRAVRVLRLEGHSVATVVLQAGHVQAGVPGAVQQFGGGADAAEQRGVVARRVAGIKADLVVAVFRITRPQQNRKPRVGKRGGAQLHLGQLAAVAIDLAGIHGSFATRCLVEAAVGEALHRGRVVPDVEAAGDIGLRQPGARGAGGPRDVPGRRPGAGPGAQVDDAAGVVDRHAVTQHQHLVGVGTADEHAGLAARPAGLHHTQAGHRGQRVNQGHVAPLLDGLAVDDGDTSGQVDHCAGNAGGCYHDVFRRVRVGLCDCRTGNGGQHGR